MPYDLQVKDGLALFSHWVDYIDSAERSISSQTYSFSLFDHERATHEGTYLCNKCSNNLCEATFQLHFANLSIVTMLANLTNQEYKSPSPFLTFQWRDYIFDVKIHNPKAPFSSSFCDEFLDLIHTRNED